MTSVTGSTDSQGFYEVSNIPFGHCSITLDPKLQLAPGSSKTVDLNEGVEFYATNFSTNDVDITYVTVNYSIIPAAYYTQMKITGNMVFEATFPPLRNGSGDTVDMSSTPETVTGSGVLFHPVVVHVSSPSTRVSDIDISKQDAGETIKVEILNFRDPNTFGGSPVDITGVQFTITFQLSDATSSVVVLTPAGAGSPDCSSYTVWNRRGNDEWVRGGGYTQTALESVETNPSPSTVERPFLYMIERDCDRDENPSPITFYDANAADSDVDCTVRWTGTVLADE